MKVSLIDFTGCNTPDPEGHAVNVLLFTKSTRLEMRPGLFKEISEWPGKKKREELEYMANTIPSSWEFVNYTFLIEQVSRGYTHQQVRTRTASFAQQTMRILNVAQGNGWDFYTGPTIEASKDLNGEYKAAMENAANSYKSLIANGAAVEDARGVLPTNILTNIVMKIDMRNFVTLVRKRSSSRVQGEYRDVLKLMQEEVLNVHPFLQLFIERTADKAANDLDAMINSLKVDQKTKNTMVKLLDQIRSAE